MPKAVWRGVTLAESDATEIVEGNHYFPPKSVCHDNLRESDAHTVCGWKGTASYYDVVVDDDVNLQAAWYYAEPKEGAAKIKHYVAFWKGVEVIE